MKEITIITTRKCNWSCAYCNIRKPNCSIDEVKLLKAFKSVMAMYTKEDYIALNLSGGEPGLLSKQLILDMLEVIAANRVPVELTIFTNGKAFWIAKLLEKNKQRFSSVIRSYRFTWHCTSSIRKLEKLRIPAAARKRTLPVAVVTASDVPYLDRFLSKNKHVRPFLALHNHCYERDTFGIKSLKSITSILEEHYGDFALRSLEVASFMSKQSNPDIGRHRAYCSTNLPGYHHVYDISSGIPRQYRCCIALSSDTGYADCSTCVNYQQFYENALNSYGYTQPILPTN